MKYLRIKKQADFQKLFSAGKRFFSPSLTVILLPSKTTRLGVSVGKRHGNSVQRNRIKRLLREVFRLSLCNIKGTYSFILIPKVEKKYSFHTFMAHFTKIIEKESL